MQSPGGNPLGLVRKSHRKSRLGCLECKRRRVKCDETRPTCNNCARRSTECSFSMTGTSTPLRQSDTPSFDLLDLELWHNWLTSACHTFTDDAMGLVMWRDNILKLAVRHGYNASLLIALSALHLARKDDTRTSALLARCNAMQASAINGMMSALSSNDPDNAGTLWMAAMLLCFCSFGKGPQPGQYLVYSDTGEPKWLGLLQRVKSIITHNQNVYEGIAPDLPPSKPKESMDPEEILEGMGEAFQDLLTSIDALRAEDKSFDKYMHPMNELRNCAAELFERPTEDAGEKVVEPRVRQYQVFAWLHRIEKDFVSSVQEKRPMALVILAHYLVLLVQMEKVWYIEGWPQHIMAAIRRDLHPAYSRWLGWPSRYVS